MHKLLIPVLLVPVLMICASQSNAVPITTVHEEEFTSGLLGFPAGTGTWRTTIDLIVPQTTVEVGKAASFIIRGEITDTLTGIAGVTNSPGTVFGFSLIDTNLRGTNVFAAQPFTSFVTITLPDKFVGDPGKATTWSLSAFDNLSSGSETQVEVLNFNLLTIKRTVNGDVVARNWFDALPNDAQHVTIIDRALSSTGHGIFTGTGGNFEIDGSFMSVEPGDFTLAFITEANYLIRGFSSLSGDILDFDFITLRQEIHEVQAMPEPSVIGIFASIIVLLLVVRLRFRTHYLTSDRPTAVAAIS